MFPRTLEETKCTGVQQERRRGIFNKKIILVQIVDTISLPALALWISASILSTAFNRCDWKISDNLIGDDQVKRVIREIKLCRVLLEVPTLWKILGQDLFLILHQSRRQIEDVIIDVGPIDSGLSNARCLVHESSCKASRATSNFQHVELSRLLQ